MTTNKPHKMHREIKTHVLIQTDPIAGTVIDVQVFGNMKVLSDEFPEISYKRLWTSLNKNSMFIQEGIEIKGQKVNVMIVPRNLQRGERKKKA